MKQLLTFVFVMFLTVGSFAQQNTSYTVKEGETIDYVAKVFRVSPNDILKSNPEAKEGLKKGMKLVIPDFGVTHYSKQKPTDFKIHSVKGQETLFGLTHKYNITIDDIKRYNQELYSRGLQVGDEITIPLFSQEVAIIEKGRPGLKKYVVKPGEGLWRIAKNHGITQKVLEKVNPEISGNLTEGQEIWVPITEVETEDNTHEGMVLYQVEKGEGFMSLQRKFGLTKSELIALNPHLREGIKLESEVWIPKDRFVQAEIENKKEGVVSYEDSNKDLLENSTSGNVHHIAYILPFRLGNKDNYDYSNLKQKLQDDKLTQIASDFYLGAKIAIDSLSKRGYKFRVQVLDSDASEEGVRQALKTPNLENAQVIIGPFLPKVFNELSRNVRNPSTALLVPVSNSSEIELRPNVFQTIPNSEYQKEVMIDYVNNIDNANVLVVADSKQGSMYRVTSKISNARLVNNIKTESLKSFMSSSKINVIIVDSNDLVFLSELVRNLHALQTSKDKLGRTIRLIALEKGSAFDGGSLSNTQLSALHFTYPTVNRFSTANNTFSKSFQQTYGMLPNRYVVRGFDMTMDVLLRLGVNSDFKVANEKLNETSQVENKFVYKQNFLRGGGYENKGVYIVEYNNMEVKQLSSNK